MIDELTEDDKKDLVAEHVRLTAQFSAGNSGAVKRLKEIEKKLSMNPVEIAKAAADEYMREYE